MHHSHTDWANTLSAHDCTVATYTLGKHTLYSWLHRGHTDWANSLSAHACTVTAWTLDQDAFPTRSQATRSRSVAFSYSNRRSHFHGQPGLMSFSFLISFFLSFFLSAFVDLRIVLFACFKHGLALSVYLFFSLILSVSPRPFLSPSSFSPVQIVSRAHYQSALVTSVVHNLFWSCLCSLSLLTIAIMLSPALFSMNNELRDETRFFSSRQLVSVLWFSKDLSSSSFCYAICSRSLI